MIKNTIEDEYLGLLSGVFHGGMDGPSRAGETRSVFGRILRHNMSKGFPLLTTKKVFIKNGITELLWILQGRTDMEYLHSHGLKYWDADYARSGRTDGTLGPVYGSQWRNFHGHDQLLSLVRGIKENPRSRRLMVSAWNPAQLDDMALPPCHYGFQVNISDGKLNLFWNQRSADLFLGLPYDIAMYGLLLQMLAKGAGLVAGELGCFLGDCHIYHNHFDAVRTQLSRKPTELPHVSIDQGIKLDRDWVTIPTHDMIHLGDYNPQAAIKAPLSVG